MWLQVLKLIKRMCYVGVSFLSEIFLVERFSESFDHLLGFDRFLLTLFAQVYKCLPIKLLLFQVGVRCL